MGFDYSHDAQPLDSEDILSNPLSDPLSHIQQYVSHRLGITQGLRTHTVGNDSVNTEHGMSQKAEVFIGGHVFFSGRGRVPRGSTPKMGPFSDGTGGEGDPPKESLFEHTAEADWSPEDSGLEDLGKRGLPDPGPGFCPSCKSANFVPWREGHLCQDCRHGFLKPYYPAIWGEPVPEQALNIPTAEMDWNDQRNSGTKESLADGTAREGNEDNAYDPTKDPDDCKAYHKEGRGGPGFIDPALDAALRQNYTPYAPQPPLMQRDPQAWVKSLTDAYTQGKINAQEYEQMLENGYRQLYQQGTDPYDLPRISAMTRSQKLQLAQQLEELHSQPDTSETLHEFPDGYSIRRLTTAGDMNREGELMSHCWRKGFWDDPQNVAEFGDAYPDHKSLLAGQWDAPLQGWTKKGYPYLSLRDPDNLPRASFYGQQVYPTYDPSYLAPMGVHGPHNSDLKPEMQNYFDEWRKAQQQNLGDANGVAVSSSRKHPPYYRDEKAYPFHHHPLTGRRCYCPWGWNKLERWRKDTQREASEKVRMLRNQNRKVFRDEKGQAFLQHLDDLVNGKTYQLANYRGDRTHDITIHHPDLEPIVPWLAHRYAQGDIAHVPYQAPVAESGSANERQGNIPKLHWFNAARHPGANDDYPQEHFAHLWSSFNYHDLTRWFHARQAPARRGVNIMDLDPKEVHEKVLEHNNYLEELERKEELGEELAQSGTPIHHFNNGLHVRELTDPDDFYNEGKALGHCIGDHDQQYINGLHNGQLRAFSLRDKEGWPHATWHINTRDNSLAHVQGASGVPKEEYRKKISEFNNHMGFGDHAVGDYEYGENEPEYDPYYDLPAADSVQSWLQLHGPDSDPWSIAHEDDYANIGENTELNYSEPDWDDIASDFLDYGPHATWENVGGRNVGDTHSEEDRNNFMQGLHLEHQAPTFDRSLREIASPGDPDHVEGLRIWDEASAPHRDLSGAFVAPAWGPNGNYVPVTDPGHPDYQEPPPNPQMPLFEASITTSDNFSSKGTTLVKTAATTNCRACGLPTDNFVGRRHPECLLPRPATGACNIHGVPYQKDATARSWCPSCAQEYLVANPRLRTLASERAATRLPTFFDWYSDRGYNPTYSAPRIASQFSGELRQEGMPTPLAHMAANHHVGRYVDALEAENPPEEDQQDNPE